MDKPVIILGAKGIAKAAYEIFKSNGIIIYGFLDDDTSLHTKEIDEVTVLGKTDDHGFLKLIGQKCEAFVAVDENKVRKSLVKMLNDQRKVMPTNAIHQHAKLSESASIGHGNFLNANAFIGSDTEIGHHCILHASCTIEHEVKLDDFVQVGAGSIIGSGVTIGQNAFIGTGATIVNGVNVGKNARIGAGSVVIADVADGETVFGNPAQKIDK